MEVKPQKPWALSPKELIYPSILLIISAIASIVVVQLTAMKGKLAIAFLFFIFSTLSMYFYKLRIRGRQAAKDSLASSVALTGALIVFAPVVSILITTIVKGLPGLHLTLFSDTMFKASYLDPINKGGLLHAIVGTIYLILLSIVISVPMGILTALYLTEIKGPGSKFIQFTVQAMSGVPSVVAGLFIFAAVILATPLKASGVVGAFALSILMIPTVTRTAQEVLNLVPNDLREAGLAMGATQWRTVASIVVPAARNGLLTATILGVARIAGETAPLIFTIGGSDKLNLNPFKDPVATIPVYIFQFLGSGYESSIQRAWGAAFVLMLVVALLFALTRIFSPKGKAR